MVVNSLDYNACFELISKCVDYEQKMVSLTMKKESKRAGERLKSVDVGVVGLN